GARPAMRGVVLVHSENPWQSPAIRSVTGALLASPDLPEARTVRAAVETSLVAMGRPASEAPAVLDAVGIAPLAGRSTRSLSFAESRAVELAVALHTARSLAKRSAPPVLILHEPCAEVAVPSIARVLDEALAELRRAEACVVIATSSPADARRLGDTLWILQRGAVLRRESGDGRTLALGDVEIAAWVGVEASGPLRALAATVSAHPAVRAAYWEDPGAGTGRAAVLRVRGADRDACALAILDAAASAGVAIEAITTSNPDLAAVRSASIAWVQRMRAGQMRAMPPRQAAPAAGNAVQGPVQTPQGSVEAPQIPAEAPKDSTEAPQVPEEVATAPAGDPSPMAATPTVTSLATPGGGGDGAQATPLRPPGGGGDGGGGPPQVP
ncbi:MAG: hypothetical protein U0441_37030, partial [Polyangiaceae bacterium]